MKKAWHNLRIRIVGFFVLGALICMLCLVSNILSRAVLGFSAWFTGALITAGLIVLCMWLSVSIQTDFRTRSVPYSKVLSALLNALKDPDPNVRAKAARGLAALDVEQSSLYNPHRNLDNILVGALKNDKDPRVRAEAAEGLADVEWEEFSHHHKHKSLDDFLYVPLQK